VCEQLDLGGDVLANPLAANSYGLGYVGKWHMSAEDPRAFGYEDYVSIGDFLKWRQEIGAPVPDEIYDYSTQFAALDPASANQSLPHFPNVVPDPYFSMYPPASIPPWPNHDESLMASRVRKRSSNGIGEPMHMAGPIGNRSCSLISARFH